MERSVWVYDIASWKYVDWIWRLLRAPAND